MIIRKHSEKQTEQLASPNINHKPSPSISSILLKIITCSWCLPKKSQPKPSPISEKRHKPAPVVPNANSRSAPPPLVRRPTGLDIPNENELHLITSDRNSKAPESVYSIRMDFGGPPGDQMTQTPTQSRPQSQHRNSSSSPSPLLPGISFSHHDTDSDSTLTPSHSHSRNRNSLSLTGGTISTITTGGSTATITAASSTAIPAATADSMARLSFDKFDCSLAPCNWEAFSPGGSGLLDINCRARKCSIIQETSEPGSACASRKQSIAAGSTHSQTTVPLGVFVTNVAGLGAVAE